MSKKTKLISDYRLLKWVCIFAAGIMLLLGPAQRVSAEEIIEEDCLIEDSGIDADVIDEDHGETIIADEEAVSELEVMSADAIEPMYAGSTDDSNPTRIDTNTKISDSMTRDNRYRYYYFELPKPGKVSFTFGHDLLSNPEEIWELELFDSNGYSTSNQILYKWFKGNTANYTEAAPVGLPAGRFYIEIYANSDGIDVNYNFTVNYTQSDTWERENDSEKRPTTVPLNKQIHGAIQNGHRNDYYMFELAKPGRVSFTFGHDVLSNPDNIWELELFSPDGYASSNMILFQWFQGSTASDVEAGIVGLPAGKFYIELYGNSDGNETEYHFTVNYSESEYWEREIDSEKKPTYIPVDKTIYGDVQNGQRYDYYWFELTSRSTIYVTFEHKELSVTTDIWNFELYNDNGYYSSDRIGDWWFKGNERNKVKTGSLTLDPGKYYICVYGNSEGIDAPYNFMISTPPVVPTSIVLDPKEMRLEAGTTGQISYSILPEGATDKTVTWSSSNDTIATVDENGLVTALKKGNAVITATTNSGNKKATCKVTVAGLTEISMKGVKVVLDQKSYAWSETGVFPIFTVSYKGKDIPADEYAISYLNESNMKAGTAVAVLTGTGIDSDKDLLCFGGIKQVKFKILPHGMTEDDISIEPVTAQTYAIGGAKAEPVVKYNGTVLVKDVDYTLSWQNNKVATTEKTKKLPTVTVKGKGNFKGSRKAEFIIVKQTISAENGFTITVKDKKWSAKKNGYMSAPVVTDAKGNKLKAGRDYEKMTINDYTFAGKDTDVIPEKGTVITVTITGKGNYTGSLSGQYSLTD